MMKKILVLTSLFAISTAAFAGFNDNNQGGGFHSSSAGKINTVAQALKAADDTMVTLTGKITGRVGNDDDEFNFQDQTGSIRIDVDDSAWRGQDVSERDTITIQGKVDRDLGRVNVDVYNIQKH